METEKIKVSSVRVELVKPNLSTTRVVQEVESLCELFSCGPFTHPGSDASEDYDILF